MGYVINMFKLLFGIKSKTTDTTTTVPSLEDITDTGDTNMKKRALHFAINNYPGTNNDLRGCVNDAYEWKDIVANVKDFDQFTLLLDNKATRSKVKKAMKEIIKKSKKGDTLFISYSGHGSKTTDYNGDEIDGVDETWYLYDGHLTDDEIREMLSKVVDGVKVIIVSDSCHSGTVTRALMSAFDTEAGYLKPRYMPPEDAVECAVASSIEAEKRFACPESGMNHILITGCKSTEYSYDAFFGKPMGALTYHATTIIRNNPNLTCNEFYAKLREKLPSDRYPQTPQLEGPEDLKNQKMF